MLGLIHPRPARILFVGLSAGAWVRAVEGIPGVESIDVVEINPAYLDLIRQRSHLEPLLEDPRIRIHIDDGRRWLRRNPDARFDAIVQNTTFHWRANVGNLLSREYFELIRDHLSPGGVMLANTTGSFDVYATAESVFTHAYRYNTFVYGSDQPLEPRIERLPSIERPDGAPFDSAQTEPLSVVSRLRSARWDSAEEFLASHPGSRAELITDDNLMSEYRHGSRFGLSLLRALEPSPPATFSVEDP
jgi:spermidine synthase